MNTLGVGVPHALQFSQLQQLAAAVGPRGEIGEVERHGRGLCRSKRHRGDRAFALNRAVLQPGLGGPAAQIAAPQLQGHGLACGLPRLGRRLGTRQGGKTLQLKLPETVLQPEGQLVLGLRPLAAAHNLRQKPPWMAGHAIVRRLAAPGVDAALECTAPARQRCQGWELRLLLEPVLQPLALAGLQGHGLQPLMHLLHLGRYGTGQGLPVAAPVSRFDAAAQHGAELRIGGAGCQSSQLLQPFGGIKPVAVTHHLQRQICALAQHFGVVVPPEPLGAPAVHAGDGLITPHQRHHHFRRIAHRQQQLQGNRELLAGGLPER